MDINGIHHNLNNVSKIDSAREINASSVNSVKNGVDGAKETKPIQDEIEISTTARRLSATSETNAASESGEVRFELVNRIREEIANGTYDTPERFDVAMERLLSRIG